MLKFMKLNKLVMVALVALGAVACEKSDKGIDDQSPKSVTINLANVQAGSRSMGDPLKKQIRLFLNVFKFFLLMVRLCTWVRKQMELLNLNTILNHSKEKAWILLQQRSISYRRM